MASRFDEALIPKQAQKYFEANSDVLVIEDDRLMSQMISEILNGVGFEVTIATDIDDAFEKLRQQPVDFIVLDILLPIADGFEIYAELQADPVTKDIPVMIVTAWANENNLKRAFEMGIYHVLAKPFTEDELLYEILALLVSSMF